MPVLCYVCGTVNSLEYRYFNPVDRWVGEVQPRLPVVLEVGHPG